MWAVLTKVFRGVLLWNCLVITKYADVVAAVETNTLKNFTWNLSCNNFFVCVVNPQLFITRFGEVVLSKHGIGNICFFKLISISSPFLYRHFAGGNAWQNRTSSRQYSYLLAIPPKYLHVPSVSDGTICSTPWYWCQVSDLYNANLFWDHGWILQSIT